MDLEEHLWTPAFWRWISCSTDKKRLEVLRKVIFHKLGTHVQNVSTDDTETPKECNSPTKAIKIKVIFPKGSLKNLDTENFKKSISTSFCKSPEKFPGRSVMDMVLRRSAETIQKVVSDVKKETVEKQLLSVKDWTLRIEKNTLPTQNTKDSEIVYKLVMEKFKHILNNYYCRSFLRSITRRRACSTILEVDEPVEEIQKEASKIEESCLIGEFNTNLGISPIHKKHDKVDGSSTKKSSKDFIANLTTSTVSFGSPIWEGKTSKTSESDFECLSNESWSTAVDMEFSTHNSPKLLGSCINSKLTQFEGGAKSIDSHSIGTSEVSTLLTSRDTESSFRSTETIFSDCREVSFAIEHEIRYQTIIQASKSMQMCMTLKDFKSRPEYLEAEKILLLATKKFEAVRKIATRLKFEHQNFTVDAKQLAITNLAFVLFEKRKQNYFIDKFTRWFVATLSHDTDVFATHVVNADKHGIVKFPNVFKFPKLTENFEITIDVYLLNIKKNWKFGRKQDTIKCLTPHKFLSLRRSPNKSPRRNGMCVLHESSFSLCGTTTITQLDLGQPSLLKLSSVPHSSDLRGTFTMSVCFYK